MDLLTTDQDHWQHHVANTGQQVGGVRSAVQPNGSLVIVIKDVTFMKKTDFYREFRTGNGMFLRSDLRNGTHVLIATAERRDLDMASYTAGYQVMGRNIRHDDGIFKNTAFHLSAEHSPPACKYSHTINNNRL